MPLLFAMSLAAGCQPGHRQRADAILKEMADEDKARQEKRDAEDLERRERDVYRYKQQQATGPLLRSSLRVGMTYADFQAVAQRCDLMRDDAASISSPAVRMEQYVFAPGMTANAAMRRDPYGPRLVIYVQDGRIANWTSTFKE